MAPTPCISAGRPSARATTPATRWPTSSAWRPTRTASTPGSSSPSTRFSATTNRAGAPPGLADVRGRGGCADRAGHGPAGGRPAADPVARLDPDRHPHAAEGPVPRRCRLLADGAGARTVAAGDRDRPSATQYGLVPRHPVLEFFIHGALCVAFSGQCYISHAHTGRSANRGECSQACRLPYTLEDGQGRIVAFDKHLLSMKDNDQSANLRALADAGIRSFKIEGRLKDVAYVKNATAHYRQLLDRIIEEAPQYSRASSGHCSYTFTPRPEKTFNRGATDYFVNGRQPTSAPSTRPASPARPAARSRASAPTGSKSTARNTSPTATASATSRAARSSPACASTWPSASADTSACSPTRCRTTPRASRSAPKSCATATRPSNACWKRNPPSAASPSPCELEETPTASR
jgi:hypothetical protein